MKANLPNIITAAALRVIPTADTHAVRVILLSSASATQYTMRGIGRRKGKYLLERDAATGKHILDIPVSLWNQEIPTGRYHDNNSIAHDLLAKPQPLMPFVTMIVPWSGTATSKPASADFFTPLRDLLVKLVPPPIVQHALTLAETGDNAALVAFVNSVSENPAVALPRFPGDRIEEKPPETPAAKRMREKRARDKAAKDLQPA